MHVEREKIILVGVILPNKTEEAFWNSMNELHSLAKTANGEVVDELIQKLERVNQASFIGSGKLEELATLVEMHEADVLYLIVNLVQLKCAIFLRRLMRE